VNLAAVAGPLAAAKACEILGVSHWVQSSTQATNAERGGQVRFKASVEILTLVCVYVTTVDRYRIARGKQ
jgi:hypothetical protein